MRIRKYNENLELNKNTFIISAFPGCGKSHLFRNMEKKVLDSDSSTFDKSEFPNNYIEHIKSNIGKVDIILVSSHGEVREALVENEIDFILIYPNKDSKEEYIERYKQRGSPEAFINLLSKNWDSWLEECSKQENCISIELKDGQYLSDIVK